jgi:hypothetical protein
MPNGLIRQWLLKPMLAGNSFSSPIADEMTSPGPRYLVLRDRRAQEDWLTCLH